MNKKLLIGIIVLIVISFFLGRVTKRSDDHSEHDQVLSVNNEGEVIWTCSMHPSIQLPEAGQCPICFMDLISVNKNDLQGGDGTPKIKLSENAKNLAGIQTTIAFRQPASLIRTLSGQVETSEKKESMITSKIAGRIDTLFIDYVGQSIRKGQKIASLYSPELLVLQNELLDAIKREKENPLDINTKLKNAAINKLRLLGYSKTDIDNIIDKNIVSDHILIRSQTSGYVLNKLVEEGQYVKTGEKLYHIADLSKVWVMLDAYENDIRWITKNQKVSIKANAWPNKLFTGKISYIDPVLSPKTRTINVRVEVNNKSGELKPDMLVYGDVYVELNDKGTPYKSQDKHPLLIPISAPLQTGKRAVVYLETQKDSTSALYEGREIELGPRVGNFFIALSGINQGDRIVTNGAFKIDGELQIKAMKSMMGSDPTDIIKGEKTLPSKSKKVFEDLLNSYLQLQSSLASDSLNSSINALKTMKAISIKVKYLGGEGYDVWNKSTVNLKEILNNRNPKSIENMRILFNDISDIIIPLEQYYGGKDTYLAYCPMAFNDKGAFWVQKGKEISNPYFGASMLRCGEIKE